MSSIVSARITLLAISVFGVRFLVFNAICGSDAASTVLHIASHSANTLLHAVFRSHLLWLCDNRNRRGCVYLRMDKIATRRAEAVIAGSSD